MLFSGKLQLISAVLLLCLLVIAIVQPVSAGPSAQTVPTAGPRPSKEPTSPPSDGSNPPAPTAVLATSPAGGKQPTPTLTQTATQTAAVTTSAGSVAADTATALPTNTAEPPRAISTSLPAATQVSQAPLPTLPTAVAAEETSLAGAWCFPIGTLILIVLFIMIFRWVRSWGQKT